MGGMNIELNIDPRNLIALGFYGARETKSIQKRDLQLNVGSEPSPFQVTKTDL